MAKMQRTGMLYQSSRILKASLGIHNIGFYRYIIKIARRPGSPVNLRTIADAVSSFEQYLIDASPRERQKLAQMLSYCFSLVSRRDSSQSYERVGSFLAQQLVLNYSTL